MLKILICIFLIFLLYPVIVYSASVEITIEYGTTTSTTTTTGTTTTIEQGSPSGPGSSGSTTSTVKIPEKIVQGAILTYSMPASYDLYQNETGSFIIKVSNDGTKILHGIRIDVSGIPINSFSVSPNIVGFLETGKFTVFSFLINPQNLTSGTYPLTITISSDETYEIAYLSLKVDPFTRDVAEKIKKSEEFNEVTKPTLISIKSLLIGVVATCSIIAAVMLILLTRNRCPLCGGKVVKEYEGDNFISYKCSKCTYYKSTVRKK